MDPNTRSLVMGAAGGAGAEKIYVEDVFSTYLYTGTGSTQTITNGIDLAGKGGMIYYKQRNGTWYPTIVDTTRGLSNRLFTSLTGGDTGGSFTALSDGFSVSGTNAIQNESGSTYASWTFRKAPKFFDIVTYTGNGVFGRTINHNLGSIPRCIIVKRTDTTGQWFVYHQSTGASAYLLLNSADAIVTGSSVWNNASPTSTSFQVASTSDVNANGGTFVAYLFAHDAGGFGDSGNESVIKCGSYIGNGGTQEINLGWEPQWLLVKNASSTGGWSLFDTMRGCAVDQSVRLRANEATAESSYNVLRPRATGFELYNGNFEVNTAGDQYIYIAIRRGPMKTPTDATKVFKADLTAVGTTFSTGFDAVDSVVMKREDIAGAPWHWMSRLTNLEYLDSASTGAGGPYSAGAIKWDLSGSFYQNAVVSPTQYLLRRAPGFFDVVCYTGTGSARTISHNLGVAPELIIIKQRNADNPWSVYYGDPTKYLKLNTTDAANTLSTYWNNTSPTSTVFTVGTKSDVNGSGSTLIAYLFATCPGVSKVGSYTGTGTTLSVDCGFTAGARFVLIKRTDSTGDWYVWDSARGIIAANDPYLLLNSTAAEVTSTDYIDPLSSGFQISSTAPAAINANGGSFVYLAIS